MRIIEIIVSPTGESTVQTKGFAGAECLESSKWLEQALGIAMPDIKTAEFHHAAAIEQVQEQR